MSDAPSLYNRVGGERSSFLPTFVFRPLTPPYVPFAYGGFKFFHLTMQTQIPPRSEHTCP